MSRQKLETLLAAGGLTAASDGVFAFALSLIYSGSLWRVWRGVAATLLGPAALTGGTRPVLIGLLMHVTVAFWWSAVFLFVLAPRAWVRRLLATRYGVLKVAALYGPFVWLAMSLAVIPFLLHRWPPAIGLRWWIQLVGHAVFVGLPIVWSVARREVVRPAASHAE